MKRLRMLGCAVAGGVFLLSGGVALAEKSVAISECGTTIAEPGHYKLMNDLVD